MPGVRMRRVVGGVFALALVAAPTALAQDTGGTYRVATTARAGGQAPATIKLKNAETKHAKVDVGERYRVVGKVFPWVSNQKVNVLLKRDEKVIQRRKVAITR